jgi:hypothetical protein
MRLFSTRPRAFREMTVTYAKSDLVAVSLVAAVVAIWAAVAGGSFSFRALLACEALFFSYYLVGSLAASVRPLAEGVLFDLPLRLLVGYGVVNTALLVLAWLSPLGILVNFCLLFALATLVLLSARERRQIPGDAACLWVVGLAVVATSLWCQDSIQPTAEQEGAVVFKPWIDGFYHAVHIRIFGASHGASTIEDFRLAEIPARLYHYGVYLLPAFVKQAADLHSYTAFAGVLAPVGVLFTGFAAYAVFGSLWGSWPGLAATMALLLLPDGAQQGMQNRFMSYHWLTQISPSATYGLALIAVAWLFVIRGSTAGNRVQVLAGWLFACVAAMYKVHYVVASALLLVVVPPLFFRGSLGLRKRALGVVLGCVAYAACLAIGRKVPGLPPIRLDASSAGEILYLIQTFALPGPLKDFLVIRVGRAFPLSSNLLYGVPYVLATTFGLFLPVLVVLVAALRRRTPLLVLLFPVILLANFLVMFFGLALDFNRSTPDELSHRPLMMVYFFVVSWVGGALGLIVTESPRFHAVARPVLIGFLVLLLAVPASLGPGVQLMGAMPKISPVRVPVPMVRVAEFMRSRGTTDDIFQDSQFDRTYIFGALAERRPFVAHTMTTMPFRADMVAKRTAAIDRLMSLDNPKLVVGTARVYGIRWFILQKGNRVNWPSKVLKPVFEVGPFTVYEF